VFEPVVANILYATICADELTVPSGIGVPNEEVATNVYITNLRTGIQYKWDSVQWLKSFEGEYLPGSWRLTLNP
jgi:hypothetical protein